MRPAQSEPAALCCHCAVYTALDNMQAPSWHQLCSAGAPRCRCLPVGAAFPYWLQSVRRQLPPTAHPPSVQKVASAMRAPTAYFLFSDEQRAAAKAELAAQGGKAGVAEVAQLIGRRWGALSDEDKQQYKERAQQLKGIAAAASMAGCSRPHSVMSAAASCSPSAAHRSRNCAVKLVISYPPARRNLHVVWFMLCSSSSGDGSSSSGRRAGRWCRQRGRRTSRRGSCACSSRGGGSATTLWLPHQLGEANYDGG